MQVALRHRGRDLTEEDVEFIRGLIAANPQASRWRLSKLLAEAWGWRQENGHLRDMVCRSLMLTLHRAGHIELPPPRQRSRNYVVERRRPEPVLVDHRPVTAKLRDLRPLEFHQVRRTGEEVLVDGLIEEHHYLGYTRPVGEHLKYLIWGGGRPLACMLWSSAPRHLGPRDRFIEWSAAARRRNIRYLAYNLRFLILPWVEVPHLASHILGRMAKVLPRDWEQLYHHPVYYLETFVDPGRFSGTCYRAANWTVLGVTTGRGKDDQTHAANRPLKEVLGYPLTPRFRELLAEVG
jgi:hypothetical protein